MIYFIMIFILFLTSDNIENNRPIVLPTVEVEVEMERITEKEEKPNLHVIGKQETQIHGSAERILNIKRVVEKLNGVKIERGETFSFNARVGERTKENGFFPAPEIFMGTLTEGVGRDVSSELNAVRSGTKSGNENCRKEGTFKAVGLCGPGMGRDGGVERKREMRKR